MGNTLRGIAKAGVLLFQKMGVGGESSMRLPDEDTSVLLNTSLGVLKQKLGCSARGFLESSYSFCGSFELYDDETPESQMMDLEISTPSHMAVVNRSHLLHSQLLSLF